MERDQELVKRCLTGDDSAWAEMLQVHSRQVYNICYRFTGRPSEAQDLTQEIFVKVFRSLQSYDPGQGNFRTWLARVCRNHLVDHYRRTRKDRLTGSLEDQRGLLEETPAPGAGPVGSVEARERSELVQAGLDRLSPDLREAVILRDLQGLDYCEIAQVVAVPEGTVKSRINRGRLELARVIKRMQQRGTKFP